MEDFRRYIYDKCLDFSIRISKLYTYLCEEKKEYVFSKQILRSGTSIGANVRESVNAQSRMDFINKLNIALKEANETEYWLDLLWRSGLITLQQYESLNEDCIELIKILKSIISSMKQKKTRT